MSLAQLHFTSVPAESGGVGGRFTAVTSGVPRAVLDEAEQLLGYEPPRDAPARPTDAELAEFPQAFSHSILSDGSRLLARTICTGAGQSGRRPAFHAHAVRLPPGERLPGGALPVTAWNSPRWAATAPAEDAPAPLESLPASGLFHRGGLIGFAASRAPWLAGFLAGLRDWSEHGPSAPRTVLVERRSADVAQWIALAGSVLPAESAERLTFTTYTRRPGTAPQQILGVLPDGAADVAGQAGRFRVHDCTDRPPTDAVRAADTVQDAWAGIAARVWLGGAPELFEEAAGLPGGRFHAGSLAAVALRAGITPGSNGRAQAATWARIHARDLDDAILREVVEALCAPLEEDRTTAESAALAGLFAALAGRAPEAVTAPLGALVLTEAVRPRGAAKPDPRPGTAPEAGVYPGPVRAPSGAPAALPDLQLRALPARLRERLAVQLSAELRSGIAADLPDGGRDTARPVELLRVAGILGVDCEDLLPGLATRLAHALLADPATAWTPAVRDALEDHFELRVALLGTLDGLASADPPAAARLLDRTSLSLSGVQSLPHLRMCAREPGLRPAGAAVAGTDGDRLTALNTLLRASGVSPFAEPLVLRTAVRLVWAGGTPTAAEARQMLGDTGSDAHRAAGTWPTLVRAALGCPGDDPDAPDLAHDLLRSFPEELEPRVRGALLLLEFAGELRAGRAGAGWTERARTLRADAEPVEPGVLEQVFGTLARQLLSPERPNGELYDLIHYGDADLLASYERAAREEHVRERLRTVPAYVADCFVAWSSSPGAGRAWDDSRTALLDKVLRPVVRALSAEDIASVERSFGPAGRHRAEEFRAWNRPGALSRLGLRLRGR